MLPRPQPGHRTEVTSDAGPSGVAVRQGLFVPSYAVGVSMPWLPPVTVERGGWRVTPIWRLADDGPVLVGVTLLAGNDQTLSRQALEMMTAAIFAAPDRRALAAAVYKRALDRGESPTKAVASALGMKVESAYNFVADLRRDSYLPPTTPGKTAA